MTHPPTLDRRGDGAGPRTCAGDSAPDLRNHAILMVLARLGVRAHEVAALCLEDINWYEGRRIVRPGKTHHERSYPSSRRSERRSPPISDGDVLRPPAASSFCTAPRPVPALRPMQRPSVGLPARALQRAGISASTRLGAHAFRHTAASQMVNQGASFKEVADVLGHQSLQTTGIYAKLRPQDLSGGGLAMDGRDPMSPHKLTPPSGRLPQCAGGSRVSDAGRAHPPARLDPLCRGPREEWSHPSPAGRGLGLCPRQPARPAVAPPNG